MSEPDNLKPLADNEARQLAEHLSLVTQSGMPMAPALRAAAEEIPQRRMAQALQTLAARLESGQSLETILASNPRFVPPYMRRLIEIGCRSGNLPLVLVQLVEIDQKKADLGRDIRKVTAYPAFLAFLAFVLIVVLGRFVVPQLSDVFREFKTILPIQTTSLLWLLRDGGWRLVAIAGAAILILVVALRASLNASRWRRLVLRFPLFGPMLFWRGVAEWLRLAALFLEQGEPLSDSLNLASGGVSDPFISAEGRWLSQSVSAGQRLGDALTVRRRLPASLVPLISWGEDHGALADSLRTAGEMFENRVRLRFVLLQSVLPPVTFIVVLLVAFWLVNAMLMPLVHLTSDLSGGNVKHFH